MMDMTSIISENQRTRIMCSLLDGTQLFKLRNVGVCDVIENGRIGNSGVLFLPGYT